MLAAYYVEKKGFAERDGFLPGHSSGFAVSMETSGFRLEGKKGTWLAFDNIWIDRK